MASKECSKGDSALSLSPSNSLNVEHSNRDEQFKQLYNELHRIATARFNGERYGHTLQPTALVNELYLRVQQHSNNFVSRDEFFGIASNMMREILIDYARKKRAVKRGSGAQKVPLEEADALSDSVADYLLELDEALKKLSAEAPRQGKVVRLKFYLGMTFEEISATLQIAASTAKSDWAFARAFLRREMSHKDG